jgi:hypothetical protein
VACSHVYLFAKQTNSIVLLRTVHYRISATLHKKRTITGAVRYYGSGSIDIVLGGYERKKITQLSPLLRMLHQVLK